LFNWFESVFEEGHAKLFELGSGDGVVEIFTFSKTVDFDGGLIGRGQKSLSSFTLSSESSHGSGVVSDIDLRFFQKLSGAVLKKFLIKIFTSEMGITSGGFDFEDTIIDGQNGDIESSTSEIENKDVSLALTRFVKTISDGGSGWLIDDSLDGHT